MLDAAAFVDMRRYIQGRIAYAKYRVGSTYYPASINGTNILGNGTVRVRLSIVPDGGTITVNRVELYNDANELWAHQDVSITVSASQTGVLYWFDFTITEV